MNRFVFDLGLGEGHEVSASGLDIFLIISFQVVEFHDGNFCVEPGEHGHQEVFLTFSVEIQVRKQEDPCLGG